jgi:hypothetical protein
MAARDTPAARIIAPIVDSLRMVLAPVLVLMVWAVALTAVDTKDAGVLGSVGAIWNAYAGEEVKEPA